MEEYLLSKHAEAEARLGYIAFISNLTLLVGLLGTITHLIKSFASVSKVKDMAEQTLILNENISLAMTITGVALLGAITFLVIYALFSNRGNYLTEEFNKNALHIYNSKLWREQ